MIKIKNLLIVIPIVIWMISCEQVEKENQEASLKYIDVSNMDTTVRPQDDFFIYANGSWLDSNEIPSSKSSWGSFNILAESNREKLRKIVEAASNDTTAAEGSITSKVGDFYDSGMDSLHIEDLGISPIKSQLEKVDQINSKKELLEVASYLKSLTVGSMFGFYVGQDEKNPDSYILNFYQSGLGLPDRDYYFKEDERSEMIRDKYKSHIAKMLQFTGLDEVKAEEAAISVFELEKELARNSRKRQDLRDAEKNYNKFLLSDFDSQLDQIDMASYLKNVGIQEVEEVVVGQPDFYNGLNNAIATLPLESWKNYLKWNIISQSANFLNHDIVKEDFNFYSTTLRGVPDMEPRWKRVMLTVNGMMGEAVGQVYVQEYFPPEAKDVAMTMINDIQAAFKERIQTLEWMSEETKEKALVKLSTFVKKIGYPDTWKDYTELEVNSQTYLKNVMRASQFEQERNYSKLGKEIDRSEWFMTPPTVNAYYNPTMNEIVFPAGILAFPFFDFKADAAINYGGIGAVIGHELTHGFDDQGSKYDETGKLNNWWTDEDREKFDSRTQVLIDQYSEFTVLDTVHINGELTLGENIADLGGISIAYDALQKYYERNGRPEKIDGFTGNQRFFLSWAQVWRIKFTDDALMQRVMTDSHSPGMLRVNGVVSNMPEFYEAFNVTEGDDLYRPKDERADIW